MKDQRDDDTEPLDEELVESLEGLEEIEDEEEEVVECNCINIRLCASYLIGNCDGRMTRPVPQPRYDQPRELSGDLSFNTPYDKDLFDE